MSWIELQWVVPSHQLHMLVAELFDLNTLGVQEDYLPGEEPPPPQPWDTDVAVKEPEHRLLKAWWAEKETTLRHRCGHWNPSEPDNRSHLSQHASDWGEDWKTHFKRHRVSDRLVVSPSWEAEAGDLIIDPKTAFGTGDHPTTRSCLRAISQWAVAGQHCLDVGCGTGILALAAAKLGMKAVGVDIDEESILEARDNAMINDLVADLPDRYSRARKLSFGCGQSIRRSVHAAPDIIRLSNIALHLQAYSLTVLIL